MFIDNHGKTYCHSRSELSWHLQFPQRLSTSVSSTFSVSFAQERVRIKKSQTSYWYHYPTPAVNPHRTGPLCRGNHNATICLPQPKELPKGLYFPYIKLPSPSPRARDPASVLCTHKELKYSEKRSNQAEGLPRGLDPGFLTRPAKKFANAWLCAFSSLPPVPTYGLSFFWVRLASRSWRNNFSYVLGDDMVRIECLPGAFSTCHRHPLGFRPC